MQQVLHYFLHFIFPAIIAYWFYKKTWKRTYITFLATMLVDLDHLLANPVYQACRCSIGFHPLHSYMACIIYVVGLLFPKLRIIALGLLMHMGTDYIDCLLSNVNCR
jgi:hypothetical protein